MSEKQELVRMRRPRKVEEKSVLPPGFPGRAELSELGITTFEQLSALQVIGDTYGQDIAEAYTAAYSDFVEADVHPDEVEGYRKAGWVEGSSTTTTSKGGELKGKLPEDFPGFAALAEADIHTYAQVRKARAEGVKISGIGDGIGAQIDQVLAVGTPE